MRICANKIGTGVRVSTLLLNIRPVNMRQFALAQQIDQLEGLALARAWGFESPNQASAARFALGLGGMSPRLPRTNSSRLRLHSRPGTGPQVPGLRLVLGGTSPSSFSPFFDSFRSAAGRDGVGVESAHDRSLQSGLRRTADPRRGRPPRGPPPTRTVGHVHDAVDMPGAPLRCCHATATRRKGRSISTSLHACMPASAR